MKRNYLLKLLLTGCALIPSLNASLVYDNSTPDLGFSLMFGAGPYSEIGDQVKLAGVNRIVQSASVQMFNAGSPDFFSATLRFYSVGAPVGGQIGSFVLTNQLAEDSAGPTFGVFTLTFGGVNLMVPDEFIFTISVQTSSNVLDLGLNQFGGPSLGQSDDTFAIVRQGSFSAQPVTGGSNFYLQLDAVSAAAVPEPGTLAMALAGLLVCCCRRDAAGTSTAPASITDPTHAG